MYAETKYYYAKVTASNGTVQWLKIGIDSKYNSWDTDWSQRNIQGTLDLDEIYTETGGNGTKVSFSEIGSCAFYSLSGLTAVKGTSVRKLKNQAFDNCTSLASIDFPNLQTIDDSSFGHCTSLKSYTIPESVTSIDGAAFYGCTNLTNLNVNSNSYYFSCENRILYNKNKNYLYAYLSSRTDTAYMVPSTVKTIGARAFYYNNYLKSVVIANGVGTIGRSAFYGSKIQSAYIPQSVSSILYGAFSYCNSLTSIKVGNPTPISLSNAIFDSSNKITLYVPQGSKEAYESANYWKDASNIVEYTPSPIIQFDDANVKSVCVANWDYDGDGELSEEEAQEISEIGTQFQGNTDITSFNELQYFTNLKTIGTTAFSGCTNLTSFKVPASLTKIGQNAFLNTAWLNAQSDGLVYIGNVLYTYKGTMPANTKIVVKDGTTCICNYAFSNQTNLIEIELPNSLLYIGTEDTSLDEYGYVFNNCTGLTTIKIPAGVKDIVRYTFRGSGLKTIELPEELESIGNSSFRSCTSLESIVIPDKVRTIGKNTFRDCSKLQQITMPSSLMSVASDAFRGCGQLQRVDISNLSGWCNVDFADYRANPLTFAHHLYLDGKEVVDFETESYCLLPYYNTYYNKWSYANYDWETIKPLVFYGCQSIKTVSIGKNITSIGNNAFYNCTGLKSVKTEGEPFTLSTSAFPTKANVSLYTPQGYLEQYQEAAVWNGFKTVKSYPNLDVNEDGEVDVLDVVDIVNHTKGLSTSNAFVHFLADLNNDKKITIADAEWVAQRIPSTGRFNELPATEGVTDIVLADNIQIRTGETNTASIQLQNTTDGLVGFQMDITLPDGISLIEKDCKLSSRITDAEQKLQIGKLSDNTFRLSATSLALQSFTENDDELINITLKATELSDGGTVNIKNIRIVTGNSERIVLADAALDIQIVDVTPTIAFQDEKVKAICLTNWDVNGDGELSMWEAAKVATIGTLFSGNTEITSFYELKHFVGLTTIDENAFLGCSNLESASIPQNITTIGDKAFYDCNKLTGVYSYMTTPPAITETGFTNYTTATLYVCRNCKTAYENADVWKRFYSIVVMMFKEGAGTEESPYLLFDPSDFKNLATDVNAGTTYSGTYFKVAKKEIDFSGVSYTAIGKASYDTNGNEVPIAFSGNLDGNGVTIMNLSTNKALFGYIGKKGLVANITIDESCKINGYESNVAGIAGSNKGTIDNCINKAPVSCTKYHVGGICGDNMGTISNCKNYGAITCKSENGMTGGIAGDLDEGNILNCENYGDVVSDGFWIGGIVGLITRQDNGQSCSVKNCLNQGDVTGPYDVGGIYGSITTSSSTYICDNMVSGCTIKSTRGTGTDRYGASVIGMSSNSNTHSNNFYTPNVVLIVGNQTYDGTTPRGVWTYDSSTQSYGPADVTDNCAAMILPDAGTEAKPFTCAEADAFVAGLTADTPTETEYYVKGKVSTIQNNFGYQYGNATFYISDDGTKNGEFYVYRTLYFDKQNYNGGRVPNLGDEVVLYGKLTNYKGTTPETANNDCRLVSINGKTVGTGLEVGDLFVAKTPEDVEMFFVVDESGKSMGKASETGCSVGYAVANKPETYTNPPCCINANYVGAITIPATAEGFPIQAIAPSAFTNSKLTSVTIPATVWDIETNAFKDCQNLTSVTMPEGVILNNGTFQNCTALTSIELPKDVQLWASETIFGGCTNLTAITVNDETPYNLQGSCLVDDPSQVTIYVPVGSREAYLAADYWKDFKEIVEKTPEVPAKVIWSGTQVIKDWNYLGIISEELTDLTIGDMLHVELSWDDVKDCFVVLNDGSWVDIAGWYTYDEHKTSTEATFLLTGDMVRFLKETGMVLTGSGYTITKVYTTPSGFTGSEKSIWIGSATDCDFLVNNVHFKNANDKNGVKVGDIIHLTYTGDGSMALYYFGKDSNWTWGSISNDTKTVTDTGADFVVTGDLTTLLNNNHLVIQVGQNTTLTQVELEETEPIATEDDVLSVAEIAARSGKTADFTIDLTNVATDLTACQFDLTLPIGITLATNEKGKYLVTKTDRFGDDNQNLTVSKIEGSANTYRVISFSMNNEVISGTSGAILNAVLAVDADVSEDTYEGMITNIVLTKVDGVQLKPADAKFNIVVNNVIPGDANGDGDINVSDIVEIVNYILEKPSARFVAAAADLNGDGEINVTDIVRVVSIIMQSNTSATRQVSAMETTDNDQLTMAVDNDGVYSLHLSNEAQYVASQFEIQLGDGQTLEGVSLNDKRSDGHQVTYTQTGNNIYKVVVFSTENRPFDGNIGELLSFQVSGNGSIEVGNILFVTSGATEKLFPSLSAGTTGIDVTKKSDAMDIYSIDGRLVRRQATNTNGLKRGMYIINGKKTIVK